MAGIKTIIGLSFVSPPQPQLQSHAGAALAPTAAS
jgi:hypothetical protein